MSRCAFARQLARCQPSSVVSMSTSREGVTALFASKAWSSAARPAGHSRSHDRSKIERPTRQVPETRKLLADADAITDAIDDVLTHANPNPSRTACPTKDTLAALATKSLPLDHPAYEHLTKCSPCYTEFRLLQKSFSGSDTRSC
jgi:hypothetical protein